MTKRDAVLEFWFGQAEKSAKISRKSPLAWFVEEPSKLHSGKSDGSGLFSTLTTPLWNAKIWTPENLDTHNFQFQAISERSIQLGKSWVSWFFLFTENRGCPGSCWFF